MNVTSGQKNRWYLLQHLSRGIFLISLNKKKDGYWESHQSPLPSPLLVIEKASINLSICRSQWTRRDFWHGNTFHDIALPPECVLILILDFNFFFLGRKIDVLVSQENCLPFPMLFLITNFFFFFFLTICCC